MLLADQKPLTSTPYHSMQSTGEYMRATLRMARLYYDRYPKVLDWSNNQGKTALHVAALKGKEELVRVRFIIRFTRLRLTGMQMLCELGADVDLSDNKGNAPLHSYVFLTVSRRCLTDTFSSASAWGHIPVGELSILLYISSHQLLRLSNSS